MMTVCIYMFVFSPKDPYIYGIQGHGRALYLVQIIDQKSLLQYINKYIPGRYMDKYQVDGYIWNTEQGKRCPAVP